MHLSTLTKQINLATLPLVESILIHRGKFSTLPDSLSNTYRFAGRVGYTPTIFGPGTSYRFAGIFEVGDTLVKFYKNPPDGSVVYIAGTQHVVVGTTTEGTILDPSLRFRVSNQNFALLVAVPLDIVSSVSNHSIQVQSTQSFSIHDKIQFGSSIFTVTEVHPNTSNSTTELLVEEVIHNNSLDQPIYLLASPLIISAPISLAQYQQDSPYLFELPQATHLDLNLTAYTKLELLDVRENILYSEEKLGKQDFLVLTNNISTGSMLLWDKLTGSLDFDGNHLWLYPDASGKAAIRAECVPVWPNLQVSQYLLTLECKLPVTVQLQLYPNPLQEFTVNGKRTLRFLGPAVLEFPVEEVRLAIKSPNFVPVKFGDLVPNLVATKLRYTTIVVPGPDLFLSDFDYLFSTPIVKPLWPSVKELYFQTDIGVTDSGFVLGV